MLHNKNSLIAGLSPADQTSLLRRATVVQLKVGELLHSDPLAPPTIYFPIDSVICLYVDKPGATQDVGLAVGLVGKEGASGLQAAIGMGTGNIKSMVQSAGDAYAVSGQEAQKITQKNNAVLLQFSRYMWQMFTEIAMLSTLGNAQDIKARLANWLLLSAQRCSPSPLKLTHAQIAQSLGVRRASITLAARDMKLKRYLNYSRGHIQLLNTDALQRLAQPQTER